MIMKAIKWDVPVIQKVKFAYCVMSFLVLLIPVEFDVKTTIMWYVIAIGNFKLSTNLLKSRV